MSDLIGQTLGQFQILSEIGRGGMGVVYRAFQPSLARYVAIKVLPPHLVAFDSSLITRFLHEARAVARLNHPNIVTIYDVGVDKGSYYIAMEEVRGQSLWDLLRTEKRLSLHRASTILVQVASALDYAHALNVVHRDVKPANILVAENDKVKLTDFGIARVAENSGLTGLGLALGTPAYMSPEQAAGEPGSAASDIYALGIVLYEMLSGAVPFQGATTVSVLYKHVHEPVPPIRQLASALPPKVDEVLRRALTKDPRARYPQAMQFAQAVEALAGPRPTTGVLPHALPTAAAMPPPLPLGHVEPTRVLPLSTAESGEETTAPVPPPAPPSPLPLHPSPLPVAQASASPLPISPIELGPITPPPKPVAPPTPPPAPVRRSVHALAVATALVVMLIFGVGYAITQSRRENHAAQGVAPAFTVALPTQVAASMVLTQATGLPAQPSRPAAQESAPLAPVLAPTPLRPEGPTVTPASSSAPPSGGLLTPKVTDTITPTTAPAVALPMLVAPPNTWSEPAARVTFTWRGVAVNGVRVETRPLVGAKEWRPWPLVKEAQFTLVYAEHRSYFTTPGAAYEWRVAVLDAESRPVAFSDSRVFYHRPLAPQSPTPRPVSPTSTSLPPTQTPVPPTVPPPVIEPPTPERPTRTPEVLTEPTRTPEPLSSG